MKFRLFASQLNLNSFLYTVVFFTVVELQLPRITGEQM